MNTKNSYNLRLKVLIGMGAFILLVVLSALYQLKTLELSERNHQLLGELKQLEELGSVYPRRSKNYVNNAARDFETYRRDVQVFYKDIVGDIEQFDVLLKKISKDFSEDVGFALPKGIQNLLGFDDHYATLNESVQMSNNTWDTFLKGFNEKIGDNKDEPRIEWGAQFIVDETPKVNEYIANMTNEYKAFLDQQRIYSLRILQLSLGLIILFGLFGLLWFYQKVIKRIGNTVEACQQVANGDYGYVLPVEGNDELTVLSQAFNVLSSRSQLVVSMLSNLQRVPSIEHALNVIVKSSGSYLPVAWAGFMTIEAGGRKMRVNNALPPKTLTGWGERDTSIEKSFGKKVSEALVHKQPVLVNDLRQFVVENADELLLRDMVKQTQIESLLALPLSSGSGWEGVMLFGSRNGEYSPEQTELLENLSPLMASTFERLAREGANPVR